MLASAHYIHADGEPLKGEVLAEKLKPDFEAFLAWRARRVALAATNLANGELPTGKDILNISLEQEMAQDQS
jgi:hypothetical protein